MDDASFLKRSVHRSFFLVSLAIICHQADTFHVELDCASACIFVHTLIFTIVCLIIFSGVHDSMNDLPGFEPLALNMIFFVGPGFKPLPLQHSLFVGPRFNSLALIACFWPVVSLAYVRNMPKCRTLNFQVHISIV